MKERILYTVLLAMAGMGECLAQVPDSVQEVLQLPVVQQDTLPTDSLLIVADTTIFSDSLPSLDTLPPKKRRFLYRTFKADYPNPNKALYLSLAFPGGGQLYNKRWWKAPIVWGGYAALIYSAKYNTGIYKRLRDAYIDAQQGLEHEFPNLDAGDLKRLRDQYDKNKQLSYIGMFGLHIIQAAEAFVDSHLKTFDVSDDLSFRIKPSMEPSLASEYPALGFGVAFSFGK
ncbi:MAG: hypothetical protein K9J46_09330 [Saprospiraceae bacterium]|nr:hypothetical protein [Saprospiraceae bacterium]